MTDKSKLDNTIMGSGHLMSVNIQSEKSEEENQKPHMITHTVNGLQLSSNKSDRFVVDMERFAHIIEKDINTNPRITFQRNLSRKGSQRGGEKKIAGNGKDTNLIATSPRDNNNNTLQGMSNTLEKPTALMWSNDQSITPPQIRVHHHHHHQISITNSNTTSTVESKSIRKRFSLRRFSLTWVINPRRMLCFFATLSCIGTILLIYFTLSMGKTNVIDNSKI